MGLLKQIELGRIQNRIAALKERVPELAKMIRVSQAQLDHFGPNSNIIPVRHAKKRMADAVKELDAIDVELAGFQVRVKELTQESS